MRDLTNDTHVLDLIPAYCLGSLEADEARRVQEHLLSCWICRNESTAFEDVAGQLSFAVPAAEPSPDLKDRLMHGVRSARPQEHVAPSSPSRPFWERLFPAWGLVSLVLILALAASSFFLWGKVNQLASMTTPGGMRAVTLTPPDENSPATGFVVISADGDDGALVVDGLPPLPEGQQYQLWLIRDGQRTSGAVFSTDENSYGGTRIRAPRSLLDYSAVGVSVEPAGGSDHPTGPQVLAGTLPGP